MPRISTSIFSEPEDFGTALNAGITCLLAPDGGKFRARLTQIVLEEVGLAASDEDQPWCAFMAVPDAAVLIALPTGHGPWPVWGGITMGANQIITLAPSERLHLRTAGPSRWGNVRLSAQTLARYACAMTGAPIPISGITCWRPQRTVLRKLLNLHRAAIRATETRPSIIVNSNAAHGLEQQLIS